MSSVWRTGNERSFTWLIEACMWVAHIIGRRLSHLLLYFFVVYFWIFSARSKRASLDYLNRALDRKATLIDVFRHYHVFGAVLLDRMFMQELEKNLSLHAHGEAELQAVQKNGTGCLLLGSHLGSFEIVRILGMRQDGLSIKVLMYEDNQARSNAVFNKLYPEMSDTVVTMGQSFSLLKVKEVIDEGHMVAILAERVFNDKKMTRRRFFGSSANFPTGPIIMAGALKIPVALFFGIYRGGNRYDIYFEKLTDRVDLSQSDRDEHIHAWVQKYVDRLEHHARSAPFNWFNFYDFWDDRS